MFRYFLDLSNKVTGMYCKDDLIVGYETYDYTSNSADTIYAHLAGVAIDELIVTVHGVVSNEVKENAVRVGALYFEESVTDMNCIKHIAEVLKIPKCSFYECSGYYGLLSSELKRAAGDDSRVSAFVDQVGSHCTVIGVSEDSSLSTFEVCTLDYLQQTVSAFCNKLIIKTLIDAKMENLDFITKQFSNADQFNDPEDVSTICMFAAFAFLEETAEYEITDSNLIKQVLQSNTSKVKKPATPKKQPAVQKQSEITPKENSVKTHKKRESKNSNQKQEKSKKPKFGFLSKLSIFFAFLSAFSMVGSLYAERYCNNQVLAITKQLEDANAIKAEKQGQLDAFKDAEAASDKTNSVYAVVDYLTSAEVADKSVISKDQSGIKITASFDKKKDAEAYGKQLKAAFKDSSFSADEITNNSSIFENSGKYVYTVELSQL